jgi:RND family efflux transporter MFP subunit
MVKADALPGNDFTGKVSLISPIIDPATGTVKVTIEVNSHRDLKPGMFTRVQLIYDRKDEAMLVPRNAVVTEDREKFVYVVEGENAIRKNILTGYINDTQVEVVEGLNEGMTIVTLGQNGLKDSAKVHVIKPVSIR